MALSVEPASHALLEQAGKKFVQYTFNVLPHAEEGIIAQPVASFTMRYSAARAMHYDAGSAASVSFPSNYVSAGSARRRVAQHGRGAQHAMPHIRAPFLNRSFATC
jgi:hypothetical protein